MLDFFYFVFIFPLEQLLSFALSGIFAATKNGALSVVLLSLFINLFLLKLLKCSDNKAAIQSARQAKFDERIARWKTVYSKAKVFAFTQTLYRQNHYHPIFALSSLGGLAIQVPFFLGVYFVIQNGNALPNADFASFSAIDSSLGIHILPILMTAITLLNVFLSSKETAARIQGSIIAVLFLILLYKMPHALVLYWTTNMAFSLIRTLFKSKTPELPKSPESPKTARTPLAPRTLKIAQYGIGALAFFSAVVFFWAITQYYENTDVLNAVGWFFKIITFIFFICFLILTLKKHSNFLDFKNLAILNTAFLICVFTPFNLYQSDMAQFYAFFTLPTLASLLGAFLLAAFLFIYLFGFFPKKYNTAAAFLLGVVLLVGIVNTFILTGDYGTMDRFVFQISSYSTPEKRLWQHAIFSLTVFLSALFLYLFLPYAKRIFQITLLTFLIVSAIHTFNITTARIEAERIFYSQYGNQNTSAPYGQELFSYSKNDKNIVVIILDMFTGSHFPYLLETFPELKSSLDGFTLFNNAIASSSATRYTLPSIIGGEYFTIYNQNQRRDHHEKAAATAFYNTGDAFARAGFNVGFIASGDVKKEQKLNRSDIFWLDDIRVLRDYFLEKNPIILDNSNIFYDVSRFLAFGLFKFAPDGDIRYAIYNGGAWFFESRAFDKNSVIENVAPYYTFSKNINTQSDKPTFKFIHSFITHFPFGISAEGGKCNYLKTGSVWKKPELFIPPESPAVVERVFHNLKSENFKEQHFDTEACSLFLLSDYLKQLKESNIYDNTQILIVSDHAGTDSIKTMPRMKPMFFGQDVLFLLKDFNARGELKTDSRLMANFDIATIFCENLKSGCPNVAPNILKNYPKNREIIVMRPNVTLVDQEADWWNVENAYKVKGNLYDPAAYTKMPKSFFSKK